MPPKKQFSKEQIIEAAFHIAQTEGIGQITIRKVANRLGCSIAPIYVNFTDVDELVQAVIQKVFHVQRRMLEEESSGHPFYDIGVASLRFAHEYPQLFRDIVVNNSARMKQRYEQQMMAQLVEQMKEDPDLGLFSDSELREILMKLRIFQLGLSVSMANDRLEESFSMDQLAEMLKQVGNEVITSTRLRKQCSEEK